MRKFAIDLFCGAGGMTCGLAQAGYIVVAGVDNEIRCRKTYIQNKNKDKSSPHFLNFDLFSCTPEHPTGQQGLAITQLKKILRENKFSRARGDRLLLAVCAPCQPFTKITKIKLTQQRAYNQSRDRNLLLSSIGLIEALKPDAILCENVEGIMTGNTVMEEFSLGLDKLNYSLKTKVVNAEKFGVPQKRKRTIAIGYNLIKNPTLPCIPDRDARIKQLVTVKETIGNLPPLVAGEVDPSIRNHRAKGLSDLNLKRISCARPGETREYLKATLYGDLSLDCHKKVSKGSFADTYTRLSADQAAPTITTKFLSITNGRFGHYDTTQNRGLSVKEGALLQTFPKRYVFYPEDNLDFSAVLIGNAVPPKIAKFFGNHIAKKI